jgi:hypothetical protein
MAVKFKEPESIEVFAGHVEWLRKTMDGHGVAVYRGSALDRALVAFGRALADKHKPMTREDARDALGVGYLARVLNEANPTVIDSITDWRLFGGTDVNLLRPAKRSEARDKVWEIFVAALLSRRIETRLEEPPDLMCRHDDRHWGVACKLLNTGKASSQRDRVVEGAQQLHDAAPKSSHGIVVVGVTDLLNHDLLMPRGSSPETVGSFPTRDAASAALHSQLLRLSNTIFTEGTLARLRRRTACMDVALYSMGITYVGKTPFILHSIVMGPELHSEEIGRAFRDVVRTTL